MKVVILSAGMGTRLEANIPKSLTKITDSKTIMDFQVEKLMSKVSSRNIFVVVGFKKDMIMEKFPNLNYVFNNQFRTTNTSKSVLQALNPPRRWRCREVTVAVRRSISSRSRSVSRTTVSRVSRTLAGPTSRVAPSGNNSAIILRMSRSR